jgi:hypothetical protein
MEKSNLIQKIALAKEDIKNTKLKKEGHNTFSHYDYFLPSQIEALVSEVCKSQRMLTKFDLIRDSLGIVGVLTIYDLDGCETMEYKLASAIPEIKATNIAQQLGGAVTYTERYLKTSAFGITDNQLDFDTDKKTEPEPKITTKPEVKKPVETKTVTKEKLTAERFASALGLLERKPFPQTIGKKVYKTKKDFGNSLIDDFDLDDTQRGTVISILNRKDAENEINEIIETQNIK